MIIAKEKDLDSYSVKKYEDIPKTISSEVNLPESVVEHAIHQFYVDLKRTINNAEATKVKIRRFGTFQCTPYGVNKRIRLWLAAYRNNKITREVAALKITGLWKLRQQFYE